MPDDPKAKVGAATLPGVPGARTPAPGAATSREGSVLVIDDDGLFATAIERSLSSQYHVLCVDNAAAALQLIGSGVKFDVILCDLMMPEMSGIDLHAAMQISHPDQAMRMIFMTGGAYTLRAQQFLESIPNFWIEKPVELPSLRALVNERLCHADRSGIA
jgi:CheY-like chemotaxis protein